MNEGINVWQALDILEIKAVNAQRNFLSNEEIAEIRNAPDRARAKTVGQQILFRHQDRSPEVSYAEYMEGVRCQIDDVITDAFKFSTN